MYEYQARVLRVVDGDTVDLQIDLGLTVSVKCRCRLLGINAPDKQPAKSDASQALSNLVMGMDLRVVTVKDRTEKYGRYLVTIYIPGHEKSVNDIMVAGGYALPYDGGPRIE